MSRVNKLSWWKQNITSILLCMRLARDIMFVVFYDQLPCCMLMMMLLLHADIFKCGDYFIGINTNNLLLNGNVGQLCVSAILICCCCCLWWWWWWRRSFLVAYITACIWRIYFEMKINKQFMVVLLLLLFYLLILYILL